MSQEPDTSVSVRILSVECSFIEETAIDTLCPLKDPEDAADARREYISSVGTAVVEIDGQEMLVPVAVTTSNTNEDWDVIGDLADSQVVVWVQAYAGSPDIPSPLDYDVEARDAVEAALRKHPAIRETIADVKAARADRLAAIEELEAGQEEESDDL